jgi:cell division transport system ATP-binding protein
MILFEQVSKKYGDREVLSNISFAINPGEFVFVVGPSGAGKSTISKLLIREIVHTSGKIMVGEYDYSAVRSKDIPFLRRQIGIVFQDNKLFPDRTVAENIALSLEIVNKPAGVITTTIDELLKVTGLVGKNNYFPQQLSGGEMQRVVIARALAMDPAVLFADEPTGNLDDETAMQIVDLLLKINHAGTTVLMSTHDMSFVKRLKKRTLVLDRGTLVEDTGVKHESNPVV